MSHHCLMVCQQFHMSGVRGVGEGAGASGLIPGIGSEFVGVVCIKVVVGGEL